MSFIGSIIEFGLQNPLTLFNTFLLIFTGYLSLSSYKFQSRTSIRESLEQLEDIEFRKEKLSPIMHDFGFRPIRGHRTTVQLKYYRFGKNPASASKLHNRLFHTTLYEANRTEEDKLSEDTFYDALQRKLSNLDGVNGVWIRNTGIFLTYDTGNAVEVRKRTEKALNMLSDWHTTNMERLTQQLEINHLASS